MYWIHCTPDFVIAGSDVQHRENNAFLSKKSDEPLKWSKFDWNAATSAHFGWISRDRSVQTPIISHRVILKALFERLLALFLISKTHFEIARSSYHEPRQISAVKMEKPFTKRRQIYPANPVSILFLSFLKVAKPVRLPTCLWSNDHSVVWHGEGTAVTDSLGSKNGPKLGRV